MNDDPNRLNMQTLRLCLGSNSHQRVSASLPGWWNEEISHIELCVKDELHVRQIDSPLLVQEVGAKTMDSNFQGMRLSRNEISHVG